MKTIKVDKVILYYMDRVDHDGSLYRFYVYKGMASEKLWRAVSAMHRGAEFRHGLVEDITGHQWSLNRYENDLLTAGCHRIAYNEMERIAKQLGWV